MSTIEVLVNEQSLRVTDGPKIASRGVNENYIKFTFDSSWDGFGKVAIFYMEENEDSVYQSIVQNDGTALVPWEVTAVDGKLCFGVAGTNNDVIYTTEIIKYNVVKGVPISGSETEPPSQTIYQQMLSLVGQIQSDVDSFESDTDNRLDVISAQMDEFIAEHAGTYGETTLWDSNNTSGETSDASGNTVTLSEAVTNYDYIDVIVHGKTITMRPEWVAQYGITSDDAFVNVEGASSSALYVDQWKIKPVDESDPDGIHFVYTHPFMWRWTGSASESATGTTASGILGYPINSIVGRKLVDDVELVDARVGVDGTVYQTVGAAIREQINDVAAGEIEVDTTLTQQGKAADAKKTGDEINAIRADITELQNAGTGLSDETKSALLACFQNVAWANSNGDTYYDALYDALYDTTWSITNNLTGCVNSNAATSVTKNASYSATITANTHYALDTVTVTMGGTDVTSTVYSSGTITIPSVTGNIVITATAVIAVSSISAVYTQSGTVYTTTSLDSLKSDLVVTATYSDSTTDTVASSDYTLSGTLTEGTSTVTVTYGGCTTTFNVTVAGPITVELTWTGTGSDSTSNVIDATQGSAYFELPFIEGDSSLVSTATAETNAFKARGAYLYNDADATTSVGVYFIDTETIESGGRTTANAPWLNFDTEYLVVPQGYYAKLIMAKSGSEAFSDNASSRTYLNSHGNFVTIR